MRNKILISLIHTCIIQYRTDSSSWLPVEIRKHILRRSENSSAVRNPPSCCYHITVIVTLLTAYCIHCHYPHLCSVTQLPLGTFTVAFSEFFYFIFSSAGYSNSITSQNSPSMHLCVNHCGTYHNC